MRRIRPIFFWTHLTAGVAASIIIFIMSATGVALALKPQILNLIERKVRFVAPGGERLPASALVASVQSAQPDAVVQSMVIDREPTAATQVGIGQGPALFVNPYTGEVLGRGSATANSVFQSLTNWHRWLAAEGEDRASARAVTGASNFAFLLLGLTGLIIWWPKQLSARFLAPILWFRRTGTSRARDFNWHNVIGFWCLPAIIIMTASGVVMSYPWANNLVYRLAGSPVPGGRGPGGPGAGGPGGAEGRAPGGNDAVARVQGEGGAPRGAGASREAGAPREGAPRGEGGGRAVVPERLDALVATATAQMPTWSTISVRMPARSGAPTSFTLTDGASWNQFARSQLTVNSETAAVMQWQPYEASTLGQKWRGWLRFAHTGELGGLAGQIVAGLGCLGGVFLVYTGLSLAFRRLWNWSLWRRFSRRVPAGAAGAVIDAR